MLTSLYEPWYEISNNLVCATSKGSYQSLCWSLYYSMTVKLLTEPHLRFLSLKGGYTGSSTSTLVKMAYCWKSHALAHMILMFFQAIGLVTGVYILTMH